MATKKRNYRKKKGYTTYWLIPLFFIIAVIPLIMRGTVIDLSELEESVWINQDTRFDVFSYWKSIWFVIATFLATGSMIWLHLNKQIEIKWPLWLSVPIGIYLFFTLASYLNSPDLGLAARGFIEIFQGVFVMMAYGLIIFVAMNLFRKESDIEWLLYSLMFIWTVVFFIGFSQYFGFDVFRYEWVQRIILPPSLESLVGNLNFTFGPRTIYATMYNTNFVGSYAALMVPISLALVFYYKDLKWLVLSLALLGMNVFVWFGSNSRAGLLGVLGAMAIFGILWYFSGRTQWKKFAILGSVFLGLLVLMNIASGGNVVNQFSRLIPSNEGLIDDYNVYIEDFRIDGFTTEFITNAESLKIVVDPNTSAISFLNLDDEPLQTISESTNVFTIDEEGYESFTISIDPNTSGINLRAYQRSITVYLTAEGFQVQGVGGLSSETVNAPRIKLLDDIERIATGRGYIWSRTIPMLPGTFFIGDGPDMYVITFPQRDIGGRLNEFTVTGINDKPHNMFLQIGVNVGVVALLALMFVYGYYFYETFKLYWKRHFETIEEYLGLGLATGILAYLIAGVFNDQIISVAPAFYALTGVGIAINMMVKNIDKNAEITE